MTGPVRRSPRAPIDTTGHRPPSPTEFATARRIVTTSGILEPLRERLDHRVGRRRSLSVEGLLVAMQVNALRPFHVATVAEHARVLNSFSEHQRDSLGIRDWNPVEAYDRTDRLFNLLNGSLEEGWHAVVGGAPARIDVAWVADRLIRASLTDIPASSRSLAVDGTDIETWGKLHGQLDEFDFDGDDDPDPTPERPRHRVKPKRRARVLGTGADGRKVYTKDPDARAGHRSATNSRDAGLYVGYELHTAVLARDAGWSDGIERVKLGADVPPVITMAVLSPAGARRDDAVVPRLIEAKEAGLPVDDVIWDRGYSQLSPDTTTHPLRQAGIGTTFRPKDPQRIARPFDEHALLIEGHLVSVHAPTELLGLLPMPPMGTTNAERARYEAAFNRLALHRFERHAGPDEDGTTRWRCPFCAGRLRSRALPKTMRRSRRAPLVDLPEGTTCCGGTVTAQAARLPHHQRFFPGTTAWRISYGRRQVAEGANSMLKGGFVNIGHKFFRVFGLTKMTLLLGFTVVGYNLDRIRSFRAKRAAEKAQTEKQPKRRAKRKTGTWTDIESKRSPVGRDPPSG